MPKALHGRMSILGLHLWITPQDFPTFSALIPSPLFTLVVTIPLLSEVPIICLHSLNHLILLAAMAHVGLVQLIRQTHGEWSFDQCAYEVKMFKGLVDVIRYLIFVNRI